VTTTTSEATSCPLAWPVGWPRASRRDRARFGAHSMVDASKLVYAELGRMGVGDWQVVISTNVSLRRDGLPYSGQAQPQDPGAAVYFVVKGARRVLACDRWDRVEHNLWAIAKHVEALRAQERWGVGTTEQAFAGYAALPEARNGRRSWSEVLGFGPGKAVLVENPRATWADVMRDRFRELARDRHPDVPGGSHAAFVELREAYEEGCRELGVEP